MAEWLIWFGLAGILVIFEIFTGTFYLLMLGLGLAAGGLAALAGMGETVQFAVAAAIGVAATFGLRQSRLGRMTRQDAATDPNVNLDIGQTLFIETWKGDEGENRTARAMYRGAFWDVELEQGAAARPGTFVIRQVRGSRLIVANSDANR